MKNGSSEKQKNHIITYSYKWKTSAIKYRNVSFIFSLRTCVLYKTVIFTLSGDSGEPVGMILCPLSVPQAPYL